MKSKQTNVIHLLPEENSRLLSLCGELDENLRYLEKCLGVEINYRGFSFRVLGKPSCIQQTLKIIEKLYHLTEHHQHLNQSDIHLVLCDSKSGIALDPITENEIVVKTSQRHIKARGKNQQTYIKNIQKYDINFGIGPSGTGKTYLAVACAVKALESREVSRIILVRPAVDAGEKLGFLPGDLVDKVDPYLRPLYDALYDMLPGDQVPKLIERSIIEIAPLAYMRGRTLNDAFIILDESQNTTPEQLKMFLTRIGYNSKAVITGDITQIDLPKSQQSGLRLALNILANVNEIAYTFFEPKDVVRHYLVQKIIEAYDKFDNQAYE